MSDVRMFPSATPESIGIPSSAVRRFLERLEEKRICMHSVMMVRGEKTLAEVYWKPFDASFKHRMYSTSKSFVSIAVGILENEGKLHLDDCVADYFPEYDKQEMHPYTAMTTVRHLLTMTTPFTNCNYTKYDDWTEAFFKTPATHLPGKSFRYDTLATVMLCMLVRRVSGMEFVAFLQDRVFRYIGMSDGIWCVQTPCGHDWGGSGVLCTTRDLACFANLCLHDGLHNGRQLIPRDYLKAATSNLVDNSISTSDPESQFGYGYQIWRTRHGFAFKGMGGQLAICIPEADFMLVTTGDDQSVSCGHTRVMEALWDEIYPYLGGPASLPEDNSAYLALQNYTQERSLLTVDGGTSSPEAARVHGRTYKLDENPMNMKWVRFLFDGGEGTMQYENATGEHELRFGFGHQHRMEFPETHYFGRSMKHPAGRGYTCHLSAAWKLPKSLVIYCYATDWYFGTLKMNIIFDGDTVTIQSEKFAEMFFDEYQGYASGVCDVPGV